MKCESYPSTSRSSQARAPSSRSLVYELLAAESPDVLALQEAPAKLGDFDPVAELLEPAAASSRPHLVRTRGPRHGPALITRYPVHFQSAQHFKPDALNGKGWWWIHHRRVVNHQHIRRAPRPRPA